MAIAQEKHMAEIFDVIVGPVFHEKQVTGIMLWEKGVEVRAHFKEEVKRSWTGWPLAESRAELDDILSEAFKATGAEPIRVRAFMGVEEHEILASTFAVLNEGKPALPHPFRESF